MAKPLKPDPVTGFLPCGSPRKSRYPERPSCEHGPMASVGSQWTCRDISRRAGRRYREANPEKDRERVRRWQEANPEKVREADRRWREARKRAGLCKGCNNSLDLQYDEVYCADCRRELRAYHRRRHLTNLEAQYRQNEQRLQELAEELGVSLEDIYQEVAI